MYGYIQLNNRGSFYNYVDVGPPRGGWGVLPSKRLATGDVPIDGVAFSQLD